MRLIIGLGNPSERYNSTRHNLGFMSLDEYAQKSLGPKITWETENKFKSQLLKLENGTILVKPQTFMNNSGLAVKLLADYYKIPASDIVVVHDDLDLLLGKIKVRQGGSAAGHHGVESIIKSLGADEFIRIRLGIGNLRSQRGEKGLENFAADKFVTEEFISTEKSKVKHMLKQAAQALELLLKEGLDTTQNQFN